MKFLMVAGEASGDSHGAGLLAELARLYGEDLEVYGIGGLKMVQQGLRPYYMLNSLQVHGLVEIVRHLPRLYRILWNLRDSLDAEKPDALILIDYPGFNLKLAAYAKSRGIPVIFFNSPQVWAWRSGRIRQIARVVDLMLVLFPFEEAIYRQVGMEAHFIGHPLLDEALHPATLQAFQHRLGLNDQRPIIALLPGSRPSEVQRHLPILLESVQMLEQQGLSAHYLLPIANTLNAQGLREALQNCPVPIQAVEQAFLECLYSAQAAIVASGTATLQTGLAGIPFVIIYKISPLSFWLAKKLAQIPYIGIVNVLAGRFIVPELLQQEFTPEKVSEAVRRILQDATYRAQMQADLQAIRAQLGQPGAYARAARLLHDFLKRPSLAK